MTAGQGAGGETEVLKGGCTVIGPMLVGLNKPVQIGGLGAKDSDIVNMAAITAYNVSAVVL